MWLYTSFIAPVPGTMLGRETPSGSRSPPIEHVFPAATGHLQAYGR